MIIDAHADILTDIANNREKGMKDVFKKRHLKNFSKAGIRAGIFVIWIDPYTVKDSYAELIDTLKHASGEILENRDILKVIKKGDDLKIEKNNKKIQMIMGVEGLRCIGEDLNLIDLLYFYGIRHVSLTWNDSNKLATGVDGDDNRGLTDLGRKAIEKLEDLGMIIDVSHANEKTFWDIISLVKKPIIASHSNCKSLCQVERNLTDDQIKAIGKTGGFIGVNIHKNFVSLDENLQNVDTFINHIDHIVNLIGIDHLAFGFDFCEYLDEYQKESTNISGLEDVSRVGKIIDALFKRGYSREDIEKISYKNFQRVIERII